MRTRVAQFATILAAATLSAAAAQAQAVGAQGWYFGGEGDWSHQDPSTLHGANAPGTFSFNEGYGVGVFGGYALGNGIRVELEAPYRHNDARTTGSFTSAGLMANAYYDFLPNNVWTPYIGGGVGGMDVSETGLTVGSRAMLDPDNDIDFAYQGIAGVKYQLNPNWAVSLDYRYLATLNPLFRIRTGDTARVNYDTQNLMLGVSYRFAPPPPPPPMVQQAPPPQPPAAPAAAPARQQNFIVFFGFNRSDLTPDTMQVLRTAAHFARTNGVAMIDVTGYTDTVGSQSYNLALSQRRAETVARYLESVGIRPNEIATAWKGKDDLRVPTANDVRDAQNRRVEIIMQQGQPGT